MHWHGVAIGLICFLVIGLFHPIVIKGEYYYGVRLWKVFLGCGIAALVASFFVHHPVLSAALGVLGFTCLWSILEVFEQRKRVKKGWFPAGPSHHRNRH